MNSNLRFPSQVTHALVATLIIALAGMGVAHAKDTDIYLEAPSVSRDDTPNILIILDNSGSMDDVVNNSPPPYDPSVNYCTDDLNAKYPTAIDPNSGKPATCATIAGRVFWSFTGKAPAPTGNTWFATSKNHCEASKSPLGNSGRYGGVKIPGFISGLGWKSLNGRIDSDLTYVDCQPDGNNADGYPRASTTTAYTSASSKEFDWFNFITDAKPTLYSANYVNYYNNTALVVPNQTKISIARSTINSIIDSFHSIRFGIMIFNNNGDADSNAGGNHGGRVIMKVDTMDDARRTAMKTVVSNIVTDGWTPLSETMWEARRYYGGLSVQYGDNDPTKLPARDLTAESGGNYISPLKYSCQKGFIIYITDGDPTNDTAANANIATQIGSTCSGNCLDDLAGWMANNDVNTTLDGTQTVRTFTVSFGTGISAAGLQLLQDAATKGQGLYLNATNSSELLGALQTALANILTDTTSFAAPALSINAFNRLYNSDDVYFALFKPADTVAWDGNLKRFRLCNTNDASSYGCKYGEIIDKYNKPAIDLTTSRIKDTSCSYWSGCSGTTDGSTVTAGGAGEHVTVPRTLYTYRGSYAGLDSSSPATPVKIEAVAGTAVRDAAVADPTILGLAPSATATDVDNLINWMRGQNPYTGASPVPNRAWNFADPMHSRPTAMTFGAVTTAGVPDKNNPIIKMFVGTNDGMLRIINNSTGAEEWAFMPKEMLNQQASLQGNPSGDHIYGLDLSPTFLVQDLNRDGIIDPSAGDKVYMYLGMRRGGRNLYAFDLTPSSTMTSQSDKLTPKLMWAIQGGVSGSDYEFLGQTWSKPVVARVRFKCTGSVCDDGDPTTNDSETRQVLIMGGGYDPNQDNVLTTTPDTMGNAIFIIDPFTGERLWWASSNAGATLQLTNMKYSIASEVALQDSDGDGAADRIYVGDVAGQMWRVDLGDQLAKNANGGTKGYAFADVGCKGGTRTDNCSATSNQQRRRFFYPPSIVETDDANYSSASKYDMVVIGSGNREDPLDLLTTRQPTVEEAVHNALFVFRDYNYTYGPPATTPAALTSADLYDATADKLGTLTGGALTTEISLLKAAKGYYINLFEPSTVTLPNGLTTTWIGEKVMAKTVVFGGIIQYTTYTPANSTNTTLTCVAAEGVGKEYAINYLNATAAFDRNNDGTNERGGVAGGGIPSEPVIVIREGGVTGLVGTSGGAASIEVGSGGSRYKTFWYDE